MPHKTRADPRRILQGECLFSVLRRHLPLGFSAPSNTKRRFYTQTLRVLLPEEMVSRSSQRSASDPENWASSPWQPATNLSHLLVRRPKSGELTSFNANKVFQVSLICHFTRWLDKIPIRGSKLNRSTEFFPLGCLEGRNPRVHIYTK